MKTLIILSFLTLSSAFANELELIPLERAPAALSEPRGTANHGTLENGECLEAQGEGYMQLFRDVDHIWGTHEMITMLKETASEMNQKFPNRGDRLQIEDISAKNGGYIEHHGSHETGQDVDLGYFKNDGIEHDPRRTGSKYATPMVEGGRVSSNFDVERNWALVKTLHKHGNVQKIFMDTALKNQLCSYARSHNDYSSNINVLRSIRFVENHEDHMHVRLRCPPNARQCRNLPESPAGSGCP